MVGRYLEKRKLAAPDQRMSQLIKVFKENPFANFVDASQTGDDLKREHDLDEHAGIRHHFDSLRAKNEVLRGRVEQRLVEQEAQALQFMDASLDVAQREAKVKRAEMAKRQRLLLFDEFLTKHKQARPLEAGGRIDLEAFVRHERSEKTVKAIVEQEMQLMKEEEADRMVNQKKGENEMTLVERSEEFVSAFESRISKMLAQLRGKKTRKTQVIEFLRKKSTGKIKEKADEELIEYEKMKEVSTANTVKKLMDNYSKVREEQVDAKISKLNSELMASAEKLPPISKEARNRLYASASYEPLKPDLPRLERQQIKKESLQGQKSALSIIKSCYRSKKENEENRHELMRLFRSPKLPATTKESTRLLNSLLSETSVQHKPAFMDHSLKKYYQKQNKFVSYRMFRENYLKVDPADGFVHVVESDEK